MSLRRLLTVPTALTFATLLLIWRVSATTGYDSHRFLAWNLALAWVPLLASLVLYRLRRRSALWLAPLALIWLLFLPNAPYLVTDLIHYGKLNPRVAHWLDFATLSAAAAAGLSIGLLSLRYAQAAFATRIGERSRLLVAGAVATCGCGVYMGRVLRLNSWDVAHPNHVASLLLPRLSSPQAHPLMIGGIVLFSLALWLAYAACCSFVHE